MKIKKINLNKRRVTGELLWHKTKEYTLVLSVAFYAIVGFAFINLFANYEPVKIEWPPKVEKIEAKVVTPTPTPEYKDLDTKGKIYRTFTDGDIAYAVAMCESSLDPSKSHKDEIEWSVGLFQINMAKGNGHGARVHASKVPGKTLDDKEEWLMDEDNNIFLAHYLQETSGWNQWSCYSKGTYQKYLWL